MDFREGDDEEIEVHTETTVKIERSLYNKLKLIAKKKNKDLKNTINCVVKNYVNREELFEHYKPFLFIVTAKDQSLYIKDEKLNKLVEVSLKYKDQKSNEILIYCHECNTDYCVHTSFALASNELGEIQFQIKKTTTNTSAK